MPFPETDTLRWNAGQTWHNWHHTVSQQIAGTYTVRYPAHNPAVTPAILNGCTQDIQQAIKVAKSRGLRLRATGSRWSLSHAPTTDGIILDTKHLQGWVKLNEGNLDPGYLGDDDARTGLFMFQCGSRVADINKLIESNEHQRSLRTSGAANGQTIVGATSTGTHGSALGFGAMHDQIVAIHLVAGDQQQYWLERASYPVVKPAFAEKLDAELVRNEVLFNAALMSFGSFGVIHNVVIETRTRFLLRAKTYLLPFDDDLRQLIVSLDPAAHPQIDDDKPPYFLQVVIDPHSNDAMVNVMYERPWEADHRPDYRMKAGGIGPSYDALSIVGRAFELNRRLIPGFFSLLSGVIDTNAKIGSWGETFGYKPPQTKVGSGSVAVAQEDALETLDLLADLNREIGPVPLVFGCRWVDRSPALLAFNKFERAMMVSLDGVANDQSAQFFREAPVRLESAGIAYTQHWGKTNVYTPERIRAAYGHDRVDAWIAARHHLLPDPADRFVFSNDYMEDRGLTA